MKIEMIEGNFPLQTGKGHYTVETPNCYFRWLEFDFGSRKKLQQKWRKQEFNDGYCLGQTEEWRDVPTETE